MLKRQILFPKRNMRSVLSLFTPEDVDAAKTNLDREFTKSHRSFANHAVNGGLFDKGG